MQVGGWVGGWVVTTREGEPGGEAEEVELGAVRSGWLDELFFFLCMGGSKGRAAVGL